MKKLIYPLAAFVIIVTSAFTFTRSQNWNVANEYSVKFKCGHGSGQLTGLKGTISFDPADLSRSAFDVSVETSSVNTGNGMLNRHLKESGWLDAGRYPVIKFSSTQITQTGNGYEAKGLLELHGIKKEIVLPFTFSNNVFSGRFTILRKDFNLATSDTEDEQEVKMDISVPVTKI